MKESEKLPFKVDLCQPYDHYLIIISGSSLLKWDCQTHQIVAQNQEFHLDNLNIFEDKIFSFHENEVILFSLDNLDRVTSFKIENFSGEVSLLEISSLLYVSGQLFILGIETFFDSSKDNRGQYRVNDEMRYQEEKGYQACLFLLKEKKDRSFLWFRDCQLLWHQEVSDSEILIPSHYHREKIIFGCEDQIFIFDLNSKEVQTFDSPEENFLNLFSRPDGKIVIESSQNCSYLFDLDTLEMKRLET